MAGKYAAVIDQLPKLPSDKPEYQERVNVVKAELRSATDPSAVGLAAIYVAIRGEKDELSSKLSEVQLRLTAVEQLLVDQYEIEGATRIVVESGASVSVQVEPYAQVVDRDANRLWALANGLERSLALPWQTVNSIAKECLLAGKPEPDGVKCYATSKIVMRRG